MPAVAVVGGGDPPPGDEEHAEEIGRQVALGGALVVTGGLAGVMAAACRGARRAGGTTLGVLPGTDRTAANPWVSVAVPTGLGEARNLLVVRAADVVVAVGGEYGTLSEIALALKVGVPVVGLDTWELRQRGRPDTGIEVASSAVEAASRALALAARAV